MRSQFVWLLASRIVATAMQAASVIVLARLIGVELFGVVSVVLALSVVISAAGDFGVSTLLAKVRATRDVGLTEGCLRFNRNSSLLIGFAFGAGVASYAVIALHEFYVLAALPIAQALEKYTECRLSIHYADGDKVTPAISLAIRRGAMLIVFLGLTLVKLEPVTAYVSAMLLGCFAAVLHLHFQMRNLDDLSGPKRVSTREVVSVAYPYFLSNFSAQSRMLDVPLVGMVAGLSASGLYAAANRLVTPFGLIAGSLTTIIMPHAARMNAQGAVGLARKLYWATAASTLVMVIVSVGAEPLLNLLLGPSFAAAAPTLAILLISLPIISLCSPLGSVLQSQGLEKLVSLNGVVFAVVGIALALGGAALLSSAGAALGIAVAYIAKCVVLVLGVEMRLPKDKSVLVGGR